MEESKVAFVTSPALDRVEFPYVVRFRPKVCWFSEALRNTMTLSKYLGGNLVVVEKTDLRESQDLDRYLKREFTKVHVESLYLSLRNLPYFRPLLHIYVSLAKSAVELSQQGFIVVLPCLPPDHWAGRTFVRRCSIFALSVYLAKLSGAQRAAIMSIDVHYGVGTQDHAEYDYQRGSTAEDSSSALTRPGRLFYLSLCSMSEVDPKVYRKAKKMPWCFLPVTIPPGARDDVFLSALDFVSRITMTYEPEVLVVQLGLDIYREDTIGEFVVSCDAFYDIGSALKTIMQNIRLRNIFIVIECVSSKESIDKAFTNFMAGLLGVEKPFHDSVKKDSSHTVKNLARESIQRVRRMLTKHWKVRVRVTL